MRMIYLFLLPVTILTSAVGPALGGALVDGPGWRWAFWINLPIGGAVLITSFIFLPRAEDSTKASNVWPKFIGLDYVGSILIAASACMVLLPLTWGAGFFVLGLWEGKVASKPILPVGMLKNPTAAITFFVTVWIGAQFGVMLFYVPQLFQITRGQSAVLAGAFIIPALVVSSIVVILAGQLQSRTGKYKAVVVVGFALSTVGMGLLSMLDEKTSLGEIIGFTIIVGFGQGCVVKTSMVGLQAAVPKSQMATATSFRYFFRMLGTALGLAFSSTCISQSLDSAVAQAGLPPSTTQTILDNPTALMSGNATILLPGLTEEDVGVILEGYSKGFSRIFMVMIAPMGICAVLSFLAPQASLGPPDAPPVEEEAATGSGTPGDIPLEPVRRS
ncbi:hypothetical protein MNV49_003034 [Pseudohyphozyma bogoriensis]|nr:hypothetical protein MNV49_003034 [Pseudohyphozyma bogoriensis]